MTDLTTTERSILVRRALGFSNEEIGRACEVGKEGIEGLVLRAADLVRSSR